MDNINNNNNMAGNSQSDVDTNSVNTYNSIQPSSPLMDNNVSNINPTPASDTNANTGSTDSSLIESLAGTPPVVESNAPVEEFPQQESSNTVPSATLTPDSSVETVDTSSNLAENLAGTPPVVESNAPVEQFPQQEPVSQAVNNDISSPEPAGMPSFGSIPVMGESVTSSPVSEQPVVTETSMQSTTSEQPTESSFDMSTPLSQPAAPVSPDTFPESPSNFTSSTPSEPVSEAPSTPAFNETEIVNTLGSEKKEKEGGNTVVIILIIVIVALLIAVGYFAYKVFLA